MAAVTLVERERHFSMAGATVSAFDVGKHRIAYRPFLGRWKYFGMAELAAVPQGMLLVGKHYRANPGIGRFHGKVFPAAHGRLFDR